MSTSVIIPLIAAAASTTVAIATRPDKPDKPDMPDKAIKDKDLKKDKTKKAARAALLSGGVEGIAQKNEGIQGRRSTLLGN